MKKYLKSNSLKYLQNIKRIENENKKIKFIKIIIRKKESSFKKQEKNII